MTSDGVTVSSADALGVRYIQGFIYGRPKEATYWHQRHPISVANGYRLNHHFLPTASFLDGKGVF